MQFQSANNIQAEFEMSVTNYLNAHLYKKDLKVYYEVQPIFLHADDVVPIGNRIFACSNYSNSLNYNSDFQIKYPLPFHVFIPNIENKFKKCITNESFYTSGDITHINMRKGK